VKRHVRPTFWVVRSRVVSAFLVVLTAVWHDWVEGISALTRTAQWVIRVGARRRLLLIAWSSPCWRDTSGAGRARAVASKASERRYFPRIWRVSRAATERVRPRLPVARQATFTFEKAACPGFLNGARISHAATKAGGLWSSQLIHSWRTPPVSFSRYRALDRPSTVSILSGRSSLAVRDLSVVPDQSAPW